MPAHQPSRETPTGPALRRVLSTVPGAPELLNLLVDELSGADLSTLLLEVFRRRAERLGPADVMRRYRSDRFVSPAPTDPAALRRAEQMMFAALPADFAAVVPAPLLPLASHSAVASVDPRKVVATIRATEVAADPTNALALEAAERRSRALAEDPRSGAPVRLAASQRVVRAQFVDAPGMLAHFQLFAMVSAGRDTGNLAFEHQHLLEHLRFAVGALSTIGLDDVEIRLTCLDEAGARLLESTRDTLTAELGAGSGFKVVEDPERTSGRGYYSKLCFKIYAAAPSGAGGVVEIADGGFVDWTALLLGNRKERLLISGYGVDRLAAY